MFYLTLQTVFGRDEQQAEHQRTTGEKPFSMLDKQPLRLHNLDFEVLA